MNETEENNILLSLLPYLTTHRDAIKLTNDHFIGSSRDWLLGSLAIFYSRYTIHNKSESRLFRIVMAFTLAFTSFYARRYDVVCALQMVSYMLPMLYSYFNANKKEGSRIIMFLLTTTILGVLSYTITQNFEIILTHSLQVLQTITPLFLKNLLYLLFPITEFTKAYESIQSFVEDPEDLHQQICQLLFVTFNIQISMGYLGIDFLTREQIRKNELVRIEVTEEQNKEKKEGILRERAKAFRRGAPNFIMTAAVPYMLQIIFLTNLNQFAYFCFRDEVHRDVRINDVFKYDYRLVAMTSESAISPECKFDY